MNLNGGNGSSRKRRTEDTMEIIKNFYSFIHIIVSKIRFNGNIKIFYKKELRRIDKDRNNIGGNYKVLET